MFTFSFLTLLLGSAIADSPELTTIHTNTASEEYQRRWNMLPRPTRNAKILRFLGPGVDDKQWSHLYLKRYLTKGESTPIRMALLNIIVRSGGDWDEKLFKAFQQEEDENLRAALLDMTKRLPTQAAEKWLALGYKDSSPLVRSATMRAIANHPDLNFSQALINALSDSNHDVRRFAIRTIGWQKEKRAQPMLIKLLQDDNATIRLRSLYALHKIAPQAAQNNVKKLNLTEDSDAKVARFARKINHPSP